MKRIIICIAILLFIFLGLICSSLYVMEIEDHYGSLQEVYFESKNGDIIVNKQTQNFGLISKDWKRIHVITKEKDTVDLYEFVNENKYEVFRSENEFYLNNLTFEKIIDLKSKKLIESIINN